MTIIKKEDWQDSGRSVRNYSSHDASPEHPQVSESEATVSDTVSDGSSQQPTVAAHDTDSPGLNFEAEREAFETELIELKKETLDAAYASGFEKGNTEGFQTGSEKALAQYQADSAALLGAINDLSSKKTQLVQMAQADLVAVSTKIARRLLTCELTLNPDVITHIVSEALTKITDKSTVIIRVHPDNLPALQANQSTLKHCVPDIQTLQLDADLDIEPGGCMIETSLGYVDATIATKMKSIELAIATVDQEAASEPDSESL